MPDLAQQEDITQDPNDHVDGGDAEGPDVTVGCRDEIAGDDRSGNAGDLIRKIDDTSNSSDAAVRSDHGGYRPPYRSCRGEASD